AQRERRFGIESAFCPANADRSAPRRPFETSLLALDLRLARELPYVADLRRHAERYRSTRERRQVEYHVLPETLTRDGGWGAELVRVARERKHVACFEPVGRTIAQQVVIQPEVHAAREDRVVLRRACGERGERTVHVEEQLRAEWGGGAARCGRAGVGCGLRRLGAARRVARRPLSQPTLR